MIYSLQKIKKDSTGFLVSDNSPMEEESSIGRRVKKLRLEWRSLLISVLQEGHLVITSPLIENFNLFIKVELAFITESDKFE